MQEVYCSLAQIYRHTLLHCVRLEAVIMKIHKKISSSLSIIGLLFKNYWIVFISGFIGLILFGYLFGFSTINPMNDAWITGMSGDMSQHYLGWLYFRESAWNFPHIGHINHLPHPSGTSIVFLDSIPLFALFFKLLQNILPQTFQYLGLFTALSFFLQGVFSALILTRFTHKRWLVLIGSAFFILSPLVISRAFAHTALTAHWLILLAILLLIYFHQRTVQLRYKTIAWSIAMALAVLIHPYFVPIVGVILLLSTINQHKTIFGSVIYLGFPALVTLLILWMLGGISSGTSSEATGLGLYSLNLLSLFAPLGYSSIFSLNITALHWEGLGYLGLGVILFVPVLYALLLKQRSTSSTKTMLGLRKYLSVKNILYGLVIAGALLFALSPVIYLGDWLIATVPLPYAAEKIWGTFRSTGRIFWPLYYLVMTYIVASVIRNSMNFKPLLLAVFMAPFLLIQTIDIIQSPGAQEKKRYVSTSLQKHSTDTLNSRLIQSACSKEKVIVLDDNLEVGAELFRELPQYLITCTPPINNGYFARPPKDSILTYAREQRREILTRASPLPDDTLYITRSKEFADEVQSTNKYSLQHINSYWILTTK